MSEHTVGDHVVGSGSRLGERILPNHQKAHLQDLKHGEEILLQPVFEVPCEQTLVRHSGV